MATRKSHAPPEPRWIPFGAGAKGRPPEGAPVLLKQVGMPDPIRRALLQQGMNQDTGKWESTWLILPHGEHNGNEYTERAVTATGDLWMLDREP
jgi:hypothetical protein